MKSLSILKLTTFAFACLFMAASCTKEGPMGPAGQNGENGTDGQDGVDGNVTCLVCHSGTNMEAKQQQFAMSEHSAGAIAVDYAGGRAGCAPCHSHELFVQTMTLGTAQDVANPSAWECSTCHGIHKTFEGQDYALRSSAPVTAIYDENVKLDLNGNSNLCAVCHQSRRAGPMLTNPDDETFRISSTHWGPHHGAQANVVAGMGFEEIPGSIPYPEAGSSPHLKLASCTGCHMADFSNGQGGHSFIPNMDACNECHTGADLDGSYDYKGKQTIIHEKLVELRNRLVELGVVEYVEADDAYEPVVGTYPTIQVSAFYNWIGLEEDRSLGAHNPEYVTALLLNTIEALQ